MMYVVVRSVMEDKPLPPRKVAYQVASDVFSVFNKWEWPILNSTGESGPFKREWIVRGAVFPSASSAAAWITTNLQDIQSAGTLNPYVMSLQDLYDLLNRSEQPSSGLSGPTIPPTV